MTKSRWSEESRECLGTQNRGRCGPHFVRGCWEPKRDRQTDANPGDLAAQFWAKEGSGEEACPHRSAALTWVSLGIAFFLSGCRKNRSLP